MEEAEDSALKGLVGEYPVYRKMHSGTRFYRIESASSFSEIQLIGSKRVVHTIAAKAYPEMVRIQDMLHDNFIYAPISEEEWSAEFDKVIPSS
ncbi:MAG: hypothetical protein WAR83_10950 [Flavobacteriales bacterium]|nr:hypothetical protein [Flavobacteriales bacterium]